MAHMIDESNTRANIAFVGETPWHSLGARLEPGRPIDVWAQQAGLAHSVRHAPVEFDARDSDGHDRQQMWADRRVLYRSDTLKPLSVVSSGYNVVQPSEVLGFFEELVRCNGFELETAGSLDGGRRVWALAKVNDGAPVIGQDVVRPYVLLATSYDGTMATTARFTTVRVVCQNTLGMADTEHGTVIRVAHSKTFDAAATRVDLGIVFDHFERFMFQARKMAKTEVNETFATEFLKKLLPAPIKTEVVNGQRIVHPQPIEDSKAFGQIMALFKGEALGHGLIEARGSAWSLLNACTQHVDWQRGRSDNTRIASAWFGSGAALKDAARKTLVEVCA